MSEPSSPGQAVAAITVAGPGASDGVALAGLTTFREDGTQ